jgi:hypothetical protein
VDQYSLHPHCKEATCGRESYLATTLLTAARTAPLFGGVKFNVFSFFLFTEQFIQRSHKSE